MNRFTKGRVLHIFQDRGAKVHFNYMKVEDPELSLKTGQKELIVILIYIINIVVEVWSNIA